MVPCIGMRVEGGGDRAYPRGRAGTRGSMSTDQFRLATAQMRLSSLARCGRSVSSVVGVFFSGWSDNETILGVGQLAIRSMPTQPPPRPFSFIAPARTKTFPAHPRLQVPPGSLPLRHPLMEHKTMQSSSTSRDAEPLSAPPSYDDPNKPSPQQLQQKRIWARLLKRIRRPSKDDEPLLPPSLIPLTERNLTEFGNPDYNDEHHAFHPLQPSRKLSISEWLQLLP